MSESLIITIVVLYFSLLFLVSQLTKGKSDNKTFFSGNKESPWYVVAFGMVGASLSGITFISVPGDVGAIDFTYFQVVIGYLFGYMIVAFVLLPIYYKYNLTSIYEYLGDRFGRNSHMTGAFFFFISRVLGAAFRLFLVAIVLQEFVFNSWGVPFEMTVILSILLIWIYTFRGGIKTVVWTDTLQTFLMILSVILSIYFITDSLDLTFSDYLKSDDFSMQNKIFVTDSLLEKNHFIKSFLGGLFITVCMTGLDQDMMQKNLTCKNIREAKKNMIVFSFILTAVTFLFIVLGALLYIYSNQNGINIPLVDNSPRTDLLFPEIALRSGLGGFLGITFILGLIAAAYSSADSALTSLTTSVCVDILKIDSNKSSSKRTRKYVHVLMSALLIAVVIFFRYYLDKNVIDSLLTVAQYTYGPLLGLFAFGIFTNYKIDDNKVYFVVIVNIILIILIGNIPPELIGGYTIGYELLPFNGLINFVGLYLIRK